MSLTVTSRTLALAGAIGGPGLANAPRMNVRIINAAKAPADVIARAQAIVAKIFSAAGIETHWQECPIADPRELWPSGCEDSEDVLVVVINAEATPGAGRQALGCSLPSVGKRNRAGVFYSRIEKVSRDPVVSLGTPFANVLAYVMAHEIGHLLLNWITHSNGGGIMGNDWTVVEFAAMRQARLFFPASQARAMQRAVSARNRRPSGR